MLWITKPPAKASRAKSALSLSTMPRERCRPKPCGRRRPERAGGASTAGESSEEEHDEGHADAA